MLPLYSYFLEYGIVDVDIDMLFREVFGVAWSQSHIVPRIDDLKSHPNYLHRLTALFAIGELAPVMSPEVVQNSLLPIVLRLSQDSVANIRFNVAKTLQVLVTRMDPQVCPLLTAVIYS